MSKDEQIKYLESKILKQFKTDKNFKIKIETREYDKSTYIKLKELKND